MSIGQNIKKYREAANMSQEALAKQLNVTQQAIDSWERLSVSPRKKTIDKLSQILHVTPNELFGYNEYDKLADPNLPKLNKKDKCDITKTLDNLINGLDGKGGIAFYDGDEELDEETRQLIAQSLKISAVLAKQKAKKKFTPKKYRKDN